MIEELARLEQVQRGRVWHIPILDTMRRVIHQLRKVSILIKLEHRRGRAVVKYPNILRQGKGS